MLRTICLRLHAYMTQAIHLMGRGVGFPKLRYYCPVCEKRVYRWQPFRRNIGGGKSRVEPERRLCPHCGCPERTRHFILYLASTGVLKSTQRFLHFAPESGLEFRLRTALGERYQTTDLFELNVDHRQDIAAMTFEDCSFDVIYCSNVLEHVMDDHAAINELFRILRKGGVVFVQVPIRAGKTYENPAITDPVDRAIHFGQADHVRYYGNDIINRLTSAGFVVEELYMPDVLDLSREELEQMNLNKRELVHRCVKPTQ